MLSFFIPFSQASSLVSDGWHMTCSDDRRILTMNHKPQMMLMIVGLLLLTLGEITRQIAILEALENYHRELINALIGIQRVGDNHDRQCRSNTIIRHHHNKLRQEGKMSVNGKRKTEAGWHVVNLSGNVVHSGNSSECAAWARSANIDIGYKFYAAVRG